MGTNSTSCTANVPLCSGTSVKVWKKASSPKRVKTWQHWRRTTKRLASRQLKAKVKKKATVMSSERPRRFPFIGSLPHGATSWLVHLNRDVSDQMLFGRVMAASHFAESA